MFTCMIFSYGIPKCKVCQSWQTKRTESAGRTRKTVTPDIKEKGYMPSMLLPGPNIKRHTGGRYPRKGKNTKNWQQGTKEMLCNDGMSAILQKR